MIDVLHLDRNSAPGVHRMFCIKVERHTLFIGLVNPKRGSVLPAYQFRS